MGWFRKSSVAAPVPGDALVDPTLALFQREARRLRPALSPDDALRELIDAYTYLVADGDDLDLRLSVESRLLADLDPDDLSIRLEHTPLPRIDPYPEDLEDAIAWIADVLTAERADVAAGRIPLRHAIAIAAFDRGPVPEHLRGHDLQLGSGPSRASEDDMTRNVEQIMLMPDRLLLQRFQHVPGAEADAIPATHRPADRRDWIHAAIRAMETRELCGMSPVRRSSLPMLGGLHIGIVDIDLQPRADGLLGFSGTLAVEATEICAISSPGDGSLSASAWRQGYDERDLDEIARYVPSAAPPIMDDQGSRPCTLIDLLLDQVQSHVVLMAYRGASTGAVMFCIDAPGDDLELLSVPIPEGGTREAAIAHVTSTYAEVLLLDEMEEMDAALLWVSLS